jgi:hypothetical protein
MTATLTLDHPLSRRDITELLATVCELRTGVTGSAVLAAVTDVLAALADTDSQEA